MVQILPFAGWRYDLCQVGALSEVTAPPTILIDECQQSELYHQHPCNVVRLVMNREEPGDTSAEERSVRADDFWRLWKREGVLLREHNDAFYIIETTFQLGGHQHVRWSVIARLRLPESLPATQSELDSIVRTDSQAVSQVTELRRICNASFSPSIALLTDLTGEDSDPRSLSDHFENVVRLLPPVECIEATGTRHRMWPLTDQTARTELERRLANFSLCLIGGAAEYSAALATRDIEQSTDPNDPTKTTLVCLIPADDAGIAFLPYVLIKPLPVALSGEEVHRLLSAELNCQSVGNESTAGEDATELARINAQQPCVALGIPDGAWMIVSPRITNEAIEPSVLVEQIGRLICADVAGGSPAVAQCLPANAADFGKFLQHSKAKGLLIVQPAWSASELLSRVGSAEMLNESSLRLYPGVPTGLVFSSMGHSRLPGA